MAKLDCFIDGDALCIVNESEFINLQESKAVFIELTPEQINEINSLDKEKRLFKPREVLE